MWERSLFHTTSGTGYLICSCVGNLCYNFPCRFSEFVVGEIESDADLRVLILGYLEDLTESPPIINGTIRYTVHVSVCACHFMQYWLQE